MTDNPMFSTRMLAYKVLREWPCPVSEAVNRSVRRCILDLVAAACAGEKSPSATAYRRMVAGRSTGGPCTIWFTGNRTGAAEAALVNSAAASSMDLDDGHRGAAGHPGASIIPAAFAVGEEMGASIQEVISAIAAGYEVGCRIGSARDFNRLPTLSTGRWCAFGATAATARLRRVSPEILSQALAIAGAQVPDLAASGYSRIMGNHVKEGIPWSTMLGIMALDLALEGFTGPLDILDHPDYFDAEAILKESASGYAVEQAYFKPYSSCRWSHAAIDSLVGILRKWNLAPSDVDCVMVHTFERALRLNNYPDPDTLEAAQYSIPFCLGAAAVRGPESLLPLRESLLHDPGIVDFAGRVFLSVDPNLDIAFPARTPARVVVESGGRRLEETVWDPKGDPANPMTTAELEHKFDRLCAAGMSESRRQRWIHILEDPFAGMPDFIDLLRS